MVAVRPRHAVALAGTSRAGGHLDLDLLRLHSQPRARALLLLDAGSDTIHLMTRPRSQVLTKYPVSFLFLKSTSFLFFFLNFKKKRKPEKTPGNPQNPRSRLALLSAMPLVSKARTARNPCEHSAMHSALSFQWLEAPAIFHPWSHMDAIGIMRSSSHLH